MEHDPEPHLIPLVLQSALGARASTTSTRTVTSSRRTTRRESVAALPYAMMLAVIVFQRLVYSQKADNDISTIL